MSGMDILSVGGAMLAPSTGGLSLIPKAAQVIGAVGKVGQIIEGVATVKDMFFGSGGGASSPTLTVDPAHSEPSGDRTREDAPDSENGSGAIPADIARLNVARQTKLALAALRAQPMSQRAAYLRANPIFRTLMDEAGNVRGTPEFEPPVVPMSQTPVSTNPSLPAGGNGNNGVYANDNWGVPQAQVMPVVVGSTAGGTATIRCMRKLRRAFRADSWRETGEIMKIINGFQGASPADMDVMVQYMETVTEEVGD